MITKGQADGSHNKGQPPNPWPIPEWWDLLPDELPAKGAMIILSTIAGGGPLAIVLLYPFVVGSFLTEAGHDHPLSQGAIIAALLAFGGWLIAALGHWRKSLGRTQSSIQVTLGWLITLVSWIGFIALTWP